MEHLISENIVKEGSVEIPEVQSPSGLKLRRLQLQLLSSSRTSVRVKLGLFNAKIHNENRRYIHRLIYQINEQDLLCHSI